MARNRLIAKHATLNTEEQALNWMEFICDLRLGRCDDLPRSMTTFSTPSGRSVLRG